MHALLRQAARTAVRVPSLAQKPSVASRAPRVFRTIVTKGYTQDHELVKYDDATGVGIVTITNYAQSALGDVVFVELPKVGDEFAQGDQIGAVESVKAASDIYAPISGIVEEINETLALEPGLLNKSPEDKGWLCKIKVSRPEELEDLMTEDSYKAEFETE
ncbi:hypothetical protein BDN72DRAFT_23743 [Pluteus cervinus]|uniref:Uncharacterized protein n=1 Tax=Pluteus cervinus TaxID=181527 RepID=A0ACD3BIU2_9AGAR|nr:hypothetical protein BDN72DRAFT_23743 [Pluteus cervinus]